MYKIEKHKMIYYSNTYIYHFIIQLPFHKMSTGGKCLGKDTPILMYDGTIQMVQNINVGDRIMGDDSTPRTVLSLARGREQMYKVYNKLGDFYICNESHILSLYHQYNSDSDSDSESKGTGTFVDISLKRYLRLPLSFHANTTLCGYKVPIQFTPKPVNIPPYILGGWLATGIWLIPNMEERTVFDDSVKKNYLINPDEKYIPHSYLCNDRNIRLLLLAGIIDGIGEFNGLHIEILQPYERLSNDIVFLARTLGFSAYNKVISKTPIYSKKVIIYGEGIDEIPLNRRMSTDIVQRQKKNTLLSPIRIEKLQIDDYYGFQIDKNKRFVLGDLTVTYNTSDFI